MLRIIKADLSVVRIPHNKRMKGRRQLLNTFKNGAAMLKGSIFQIKLDINVAYVPNALFQQIPEYRSKIIRFGTVILD
ncbi:hypothetical protein D3C80_1731990 [compost metagenome]